MGILCQYTSFWNRSYTLAPSWLKIFWKSCFDIVYPHINYAYPHDLFCLQLQESCADFEESAWFNDLLFYGYDEEVILHRVDDDDDVKVLPSIVDKVLVPKLTGKVLDSIFSTLWSLLNTSGIVIDIVMALRKSSFQA